MKKSPDINAKKQQVIADLIYDYPLNQFTVEADAVVCEKLKSKNRRAMALSVAMYAAIVFSAIMGTMYAIETVATDLSADNTKIVNTESAKKKQRADAVLYTLIGLSSFAFGGNVGASLADIKSKKRLSNATVQHRAKEILVLLEKLKQRPLTYAEYRNFRHLRNFCIKGSVYGTNVNLPKMVAHLGQVDPSYNTDVVLVNLNTVRKMQWRIEKHR